MKNIIKIRVKNLSNLFIGGAPKPFEIGGIDQWTAVDNEGFPCIPASSLKGALRAVVKEDQSADASKIAELYANYLTKEREEGRERIRECVKEDTEMLARIENRYNEAIKNASAGNLFGIGQFNNTPKLLFNDLKLKGNRDLNKCFSIDTKTSINCEGEEPKSNPRTYKTARIGLEFEGEIEFYQFDPPYFDEEALKVCKAFVINNLKKFNEGVYRLGNSKSRGYGKIFVSIVEEDGGEECENI